MTEPRVIRIAHRASVPLTPQASRNRERSRTRPLNIRLLSSERRFRSGTDRPAARRHRHSLTGQFRSFSTEDRIPANRPFASQV
jgi:hypothetical protein